MILLFYTKGLIDCFNMKSGKKRSILCVCVCVCVCNKVLLKYKGDREASDIGIRRGQKEYPPASLQLDVI